MKPLVDAFLKRFGEWATALKERYASDLFFHTSLNVIVVSAGFLLVCLIAFALSLWMSSFAWLIFLGTVCLAIVCWVALVRVMIRPARDTLYYQKVFISNVAHELRTPLSTIKTSTEVALFDDKMPMPMRRIFTEIVGELDRISEIINNLLSLNILNRPERMEFHNVDVGPVLDKAVRHMSTLARERNIQMVVKKDSHPVVWGNITALEQIMTNLIKNAVSYTPKNSNGIVTISVYPDYQGSVIFSVVDTGIGISQKDLFHIFEPFYRADTSRVRNVSKVGSGLGLTIVNELVRVHHGKIHIQSTPKVGTTVSILLPAGLETQTLPMEEGEYPGSEISLDFSKKAA